MTIIRVRFDSAAPHDVEETDVPFARPDGIELLARVYRPGAGGATRRGGRRARRGVDAAPRACPAESMAAYPVCDPLARYQYVLSRKDELPQPSGFSAQRLIDAHHGVFRDEAHMAEASVTRIVGSGSADALPPVWVGQPEMDDNVPAAITDAFVEA